MSCFKKCVYASVDVCASKCSLENLNFCVASYDECKFISGSDTWILKHFLTAVVVQQANSKITISYQKKKHTFCNFHDYL